MSTRPMNHTIDSDPIQQGTTESRLYPPSFVDRVMNAVERLPIPYGLTYLVLFVLQSIALHVLAWVEGWLAPYSFNPLILLFPMWLWGPLAIVTYLDSLSLEALSSFSPLLDTQPEAMRRLKYEFTTMPAGSVIISGVIWSGLYFIFTYLTFDSAYVTTGYGPFGTVVAIIEGLISFSVGSVVYYHSIRQLRLVDRTVRMVKQFDLFRLDPVYAFSVVTSRTSVSWVILLSLTLLIVPIQIAFVPLLVTLILQVVMAVAAFTLPLRIVNHRLASEKRRLLAELDQRVKAALARLHQCLDDNALGEVEKLNAALAGLNVERDLLARIPTWPWRAGMLSGFLSIVVLPIVLFLLQLVLGRLLGR